MKGWKRSMLWRDTGLKWVETSPYISNLQSVYEDAFIALSAFVSLSYYDTCNFLKFESSWNSGRHFRAFSSRYIIPIAIIEYLEEGVFKKRRQGFSLSVGGDHNNLVEISIRDIRKTKPALFGLAMLALAQKYTRFYTYSKEAIQFISAHIGDQELVDTLVNMHRIDVSYFEKKWDDAAQNFIEQAKASYLYE
jgi:uncharacterized protein YbbC (DUF1343 family)